MIASTIPLRDIFIAFTSSKPTHYKAVTGLIFTSGLNLTSISKLTLNDFFNSCSEYFHDYESKTLENLLNKDPTKIIPCWNLEYKQQLTFNSHETTYFIFTYLKEKRLNDLDDLKQPLFKTSTNKFYTPSKLSSYITEFNDVLAIHNDFNEPYFKSKNLLNTFKGICESKLRVDSLYKDMIISLFMGKNKQRFVLL